MFRASDDDTIGAPGARVALREGCSGGDHFQGRSWPGSRNTMPCSYARLPIINHFSFTFRPESHGAGNARN